MIRIYTHDLRQSPIHRLQMLVPTMQSLVTIPGGGGEGGTPCNGLYVDAPPESSTDLFQALGISKGR